MKKYICTTLALILALSLPISVFGRGIFAVNSAIAATEAPNVCTISVAAGEILSFSASDLERRIGLNSGELGGITITNLPSGSQGSLYLDGVEVEAYEFLDRQSIDRMCYVPGEAVSGAIITFLPQSRDSVQTNLSIQVLAAGNEPPVIEDLSIETAQNLSKHATISAYDPEGGNVLIQVITKPQKGEVAFNGLQFTYQPYKDTAGTDSFTVCAVDNASSYSREATVNVTIEKTGTGFSYVDMANNPSAYAAWKLQEAGVYCGEKIGSNHFFYPDQDVTRGDFLIWLLSAAGLSDSVQASVNTGLPNDASLPNWIKPYVAAGLKAGIVTDGQAFNYLETPTRSEAVVMTDLAAKINDVKDYTLTMPDVGDIPGWALPSYKDLAAYKMLDLHDGNAYPSRALTNSYAADLAWQLYKHCHR